MAPEKETTMKFTRIESVLAPTLALWIGIIAGLASLTACAGTGSSSQPPPPPPPPPVAVNISPLAITMNQGETTGFTAQVTGSTNQAVTWSIQEGASGGVMTSGGLYTAPTSAGTFHVVATSQADSTKSAVAPVTVLALSVSIFPQTDTLGPKGVRQFAATVHGTINTAVTWSVQEGAAGGTIDTSGTYVASATPGTYHVLATSTADPAQVASCTVTLTPSGFTPVGDMTTSRWAHTATRLPDGTVLVAGGLDSDGSNGLTSAETYDPASKNFAITAQNMAEPRAFHTATLLNDGTLLLAGGGFGADLSAEIYDPVAKTFKLVSTNMNAQRNAFTATLLPDGRVLLVGGSDNNAATITSTGEIYDPTKGTFTPTTNNMSLPRFDHTATLLNNGKVLITGGFSDFSGTAVRQAEVFDPGSGTFTDASAMVDPRGEHSASLLPDGTVLVVGGLANVHSSTLVFYRDAEVFNLNSTFVPGATLLAARARHTADVLSNGTVLLVGGHDDVSAALASVEIYDVNTTTFAESGNLFQWRAYHAATVLSNGDVLVTGGIGRLQTGMSSAELYH